MLVKRAEALGVPGGAVETAMNDGTSAKAAMVCRGIHFDNHVDSSSIFSEC